MTAPPIVIVPGLMGTRLVDPASRQKIWDSLPSRGRPFAAVLRRLVDPTPLAPDTATDNIPLLAPRVTNAEAARARTIPNFGNITYEFYGRLALELTAPAFRAAAQAGFGTAPAVYIAGYDWRRSNMFAAATLQRVIERARADTGASQVILIAHSMGGLVSRWFCRHGTPGASAVASLILLGSPTHGASLAYRQLRFGLDLRGRPGTDGALAALFWDAVYARVDAVLIRSFQSIYELLPTSHFCRSNPDWLRFDARAAGIPNAGDADRLYGNPVVGVPGTGVAEHLRLRSEFDRRLGLYMPNPTYVFYSAGLPTETSYELLVNGVRDIRPLGHGDGTVPAFSGSADGCGLGAGGRVSLPAIEHKAIPVDPRVIRAIASLVLTRVPIPAAPAREAEEFALAA